MSIASVAAAAAPAIENAAAILAEASAIEQIIVTLEPGALTLLTTEWDKVKTAISTIVTAAKTFQSASWVGKATTAFNLLGAVLSIGTVAEGIYTDGETYFAAQWPTVKTHIDNILAMIGVKSATPAAAASTQTVVQADASGV